MNLDLDLRNASVYEDLTLDEIEECATPHNNYLNDMAGTNNINESMDNSSYSPPGYAPGEGDE